MKIIKTKNKKGFTLVEVLAAIVISSLSIFVMTQISVNATNLAIKNKAADRATQIYSATAQTLLSIKPKVDFPGSLYCGANYSGTQTYPVYLDFGTDGITPVVKEPNPSYPVGIKNITKLPSPDGNLTTGNQLTYLQDNILVANADDIKDGFYRSISFRYSSTFKSLSVQISIYWNIYGQDYFYTNYNIFNVGDCAP